MLERPDLIEDLANRHGAKDATARKTAFAELKAAQPHPSQYAPESMPIPERSWAYRLAKKIAYHDYGVYDKHFSADKWQDPKDVDPPKNKSELIQLK